MADRSAALLVIDMLVDFFDRHSVLTSQRARLVAGINELVDVFRALGHPIIWVRQEFKPDLSDAFLEMKRAHLSVTIKGTQGCEILSELHRSASDGVIVKKRYSAFFNTTLDELLARSMPASLVVAGINTHACVRTTVIDAYQRDLDVILASQCIGSHDLEHHDVTLRYLDGKMARVLTNEEIIRVISATGAT